MRADLYLVQQGHFDSRARAQAAIRAGLVSVNGRVLKKPSATIADGATVMAGDLHPYVSRGGLKLAHALDVFDVDPSGRVCLDVGSSTGGFTDVLLRRGAVRVYAVDVGRDQLHVSLRQDDRVVSMEGQDARELRADLFEAGQDQALDLLVCDASFISITKVLGPALTLTREAVLLIKPQFEVGRSNIGKGGIVRSGADEALEAVKRWLRGEGWRVLAVTDSPVKGGSGNAEYLLHAVRR
ncbi:TlyA family RNA methyltransferase [Algimonas porphyrae]|uniref:TlyA family rRNA (Cytidine-2'-O)-methyltransferase n=1 Tax=Algimonas porphyrae TaxID=1128113 RepID=A0ABQ5V0W0_9PROT|nr:TlyA family RNA methyltransferase [Algimonas porphyrae]GLQ19867.1 TlyA family rRNA (cytidine-2'-O)-methyltransferase [Algimonas porphyrae]